MKKVEEQDGQAVKVWKEYLNNLAILISNLRMAYDMDIILGGEVGGYLADHMITLGKKVMEYNGFEHEARYLKVYRPLLKHYNDQNDEKLENPEKKHF